MVPYLSLGKRLLSSGREYGFPVVLHAHNRPAFGFRFVETFVELAAESRLGKPDVLAPQVSRMLADPRARRALGALEVAVLSSEPAGVAGVERQRAPRLLSYWGLGGASTPATPSSPRCRLW